MNFVDSAQDFYQNRAFEVDKELKASSLKRQRDDMGFSTPPSKRRNEVFGDIPEAEDEDVDRETVEKPGFVEDGEDGNGSQVNQDPPPLEDSAVPTPAEETQEVQDLVGVAKEAKKIPGLTIQVRPLSNVVEGLKEDKSDED